VSLNLPIARHVIGTRSTRTTHPRVIFDFQELFTLVAGTEIRVRNPLFWFTKTEVVQRLSLLHCQDLITTSFSCSRVGLRTTRTRHCGRCSQCIDRRFAILSAGLAGHEPAETYAVDLFNDGRELGAEVTLAASYILAARTFANMSEGAFTGRYGEIFRAVPYISGSPLEKIARLHKLHERHGKAVIEVVNRHLVSAANLDAIVTGGRSNLVAIVQPSGNAALESGAMDIAPEPMQVDAVEIEPAPTDQAASLELRPIDRPIAFAIEEPCGRVLFRGGVELSGADFKLFNVLREIFDEDQAGNVPPESARPLTTGEIAHRLGVAEPTVRKNVTRSRRSLQEQFRDKLTASLGSEDIIENIPPYGYRLNPHLARQPKWKIELSATRPPAMPQPDSGDAANSNPRH
jgi:hypothetical protein